MTVKPIGDKILVQFAEASDRSAGGIYIPEGAKEKPQEAKVIDVGTGKLTESGQRVPFDVTIGERVLVAKYAGTELKVDGKSYRLVTEDDILAVLQ